MTTTKITVRKTMYASGTYDDFQEALKRWPYWKDFLGFLNRESPSVANQLMKENFPGNYTLQQRYDSNLGGFYYTIEWENEADEVFWLLKYA
jgi:hypothetical protein